MPARTLMRVLETSTELARIAIEDITGVLQHPGINAEDRLDVMLALTRRKPANVFWPVFHATWPGCDDTHHARNRLLKVLSSRDAEARSTDYLADDARVFLEALPNPFVAFRGCSKARVIGLSWTTSESVAKEFARGRHGRAISNPCLVTASVPKSAVFGVYMNGEEAELVINPRRVRLSISHLDSATNLTRPFSVRSMNSSQPDKFSSEGEQFIRLTSGRSSHRAA